MTIGRDLRYTLSVSVKFVCPCRPTTAKTIPKGDAWLHEPKLDVLEPDCQGTVTGAIVALAQWPQSLRMATIQWLPGPPGRRTPSADAESTLLPNDN